MKSNIGNVDRVVRVLAGFAVLGAGFYYQSWWGCFRPCASRCCSHWLVSSLCAIGHQYLQQGKLVRGYIYQLARHDLSLASLSSGSHYTAMIIEDLDPISLVSGKVVADPG